MDYDAIALQMILDYCERDCLPEKAQYIVDLLSLKLQKYYESIENDTENIKSIQDMSSNVHFHKPIGMSDIFKEFKVLLNPYRGFPKSNFCKC